MFQICQISYRFSGNHTVSLGVVSNIEIFIGSSLYLSITEVVPDVFYLHHLEIPLPRRVQSLDEKMSELTASREYSDWDLNVNVNGNVNVDGCCCCCCS